MAANTLAGVNGTGRSHTPTASARYAQVRVSLQNDCLGKFFHDLSAPQIARSTNTGHESPNDLAALIAGD
jgi:hypothetical protein